MAICPYLQEFSRIIAALPAPLATKLLADDIHLIQPQAATLRQPKVALVALSHGDEVIGLHLFLALLTRLTTTPTWLQGELVLVLANRAAYFKQQRYVESDLNRAYGPNPHPTQETHRAAEIKRAVQDCDYIIDIHQCIEPTHHPFFILPYSTKAYAWLQSVAPEIPVILRQEIKQATTLASYGYLQNKMAVTFEVGATGFDDAQLALGMQKLVQFLAYAWGARPVNTGPKSPAYVFKHFAPYSAGTVRFAQAFKHFDPVQAEQVIAYVDEVPITTPIAGNILLYPRHWFAQGSPTQADGLFFVLQRLP